MMPAPFQKQHRRFEGSDLVELIRQALPLHMDCEVIAPEVTYFDNPTEGLFVVNAYGRWSIAVGEIERFKHTETEPNQRLGLSEMGTPVLTRQPNTQGGDEREAAAMQDFKTRVGPYLSTSRQALSVC